MRRDAVRRRRAAILRAWEWGFAALGALCLAGYAVACGHTAWYQSRERQAFEQALAEVARASHDRSEWSSERVRQFEASSGALPEAVARLDVPDAGLSVMVLEGTDAWTLNRAVGRIEGTARPGEDGNIGIAGHRDGFFRGLRHLEIGDTLTLTSLEGVAYYEVVDLAVVSPFEVGVLGPTAEPTLTLVTCYPFYYVGDAPERFIVRAQRTRLEPWSTRPALERDVDSEAGAVERTGS
ncbi:MAG TPA: class D sortase [Myxococcota bacterium]